MEYKKLSASASMASLIIYAIDRSTKDPNVWSGKTIYSAILTGGLSVLISSAQYLDQDIKGSD